MTRKSEQIQVIDRVMTRLQKNMLQLDSRNLQQICVSCCDIKMSNEKLVWRAKVRDLRKIKHASADTPDSSLLEPILSVTNPAAKNLPLFAARNDCKPKLGDVQHLSSDLKMSFLYFTRCVIMFFINKQQLESRVEAAGDGARVLRKQA